MSGLRRTHRRGLRHRVTVALATLALIAGACGDGDAESTTTTAAPVTTTTAAPTTTTSTSTTTTTATPTTVATATEGDSVQVTALDYRYEGLPATVPSGTAFTLDNASETELHEMVIFQLPGYEARTLEELAQLPPERLELVLGAPASVILAPPGGAPSFPVVGDGTLRGSGRYVVFCFIPIGADVDEYLTQAAEGDGPPQVEGGPPHFTAGMLGEMIVES